MNTSEQREERESEAWLIAVAVVNLCGGEPEHVAGVADYLTEKLARLRTHSPEEPVGYVVVWRHNGEVYDCSGVFKKDFNAYAERDALRERWEGFEFEVHPIGQPLDGEGS